MERVAVDIFGPLPLTKQGITYILVISDLFTKWTEAIAIPNQESTTICKAFVDNFITKYGTPLHIHSDQGRNFHSHTFKGMCTVLGIDKTRTTSFRPQSNGGIERFNRTLASILTMYCEKNQETWENYLQQVMMAYRSSVHASTTRTPNSMLFGREITLPLQALIPQPRETTMAQGTSDDYMDHLKNKLEQNHAIARKSLKRVSQYQKRRYELKAKKQSFKKGQSVWIYEPTRKIGVCSKFTSKWKGPFIVEKKIDDVTYRVKRSTRQPSSVYHVDRLALYNGRNIPSWASRFRRNIVEEADNREVNLSSEEDTSMREIQRIQTYSTFYFKDRSVERRFGSGLANH